MSNPTLSIIITAWSGTNYELFIKYFKYFFYKENDDKEDGPWVEDIEDVYADDVYEVDYDKNMQVERLKSLDNIEFLLVIDNKVDDFNIDHKKYIDNGLLEKFINDGDNNNRLLKNIINKKIKHNKKRYEKIKESCNYLMNYFKNDNIIYNFYKRLCLMIESHDFKGTYMSSISEQLYEQVANLCIEMFYKLNTKKLIDETINVMRTVKHTNYKIIYSNEPSSLSTSRNIGAKESTGDWLMFFDDDDPHINIDCIYNMLLDFKDKEVYYNEKYEEVMNNKYAVYTIPCDVIIGYYLNFKKGPLRSVWGRFYKRKVFETFNNNSNYYREDVPFNCLVNSYFPVFCTNDEIKYNIISYTQSNQYDDSVIYIDENNNEHRIDIDLINTVYLAMNIERICELHKDDQDNINYEIFKRNVYCYCNEFNKLYTAYYYIYNKLLENIICVNEKDKYIYNGYASTFNLIKEAFFNQNQVCSFTVIEPNKENYTVYHSVGNSDERVIKYMNDHEVTNSQSIDENNVVIINEYLHNNKLNTVLLGGFISLILLLLKITILIIIVCVIVLIFKQVKISSGI